MGQASASWTGRRQAAVKAGCVGGCFGLAALAGFRWWERWDREQVCTGVFGDCMNRTLSPLLIGVPVLVIVAFACLLALGAERPWLIVPVAAPLNGVAAVAVHAMEPRPAAVLVVSVTTWALAGWVAVRPRST